MNVAVLVTKSVGGFSGSGSGCGIMRRLQLHCVSVNAVVANAVAANAVAANVVAGIAVSAVAAADAAVSAMLAMF